MLQQDGQPFTSIDVILLSLPGDIITRVCVCLFVAFDVISWIVQLWFSLNLSRAGLRHVRGVRPNRAAKFRGAAISDLPKINLFRTFQKLTCQFERLWMMFIWRKLPAERPYQIRPEPGLAFILPLIAMVTKEQKCCVGASRCVLKAFNTAKCDCGGAPPRTPLEKLTAFPRTHGGATA